MCLIQLAIWATLEVCIWGSSLSEHRQPVKHSILNRTKCRFNLDCVQLGKMWDVWRRLFWQGVWEMHFVQSWFQQHLLNLWQTIICHSSRLISTWLLYLDIKMQSETFSCHTQMWTWTFQLKVLQCYLYHYIRDSFIYSTCLWSITRGQRSLIWTNVAVTIITGLNHPWSLPVECTFLKEL